MKIDTSFCLISPNSKLKLGDRPTLTEALYSSKTEYEKILTTNTVKLSSQQQLLYAQNQHSILVILQALDTAGKDGVIRHVFSGLNPQGCRVYSFKHPSAHELEHDFLWRTSLCLPERGSIAVFNRSYYEEVLVVRVHPHILEAQKVPSVSRNKDQVWKERFQSIVDHESHLSRNGTKIIKIFLHLSKEEQRKRLLARIDNEEKNWKFSQSDIEERKFWNEYLKAYEDCIQSTSHKDAPWFVVPADDKRNARLIVSQILLETLQNLKMTYPLSDPTRSKDLQKFRKILEKE